MGKPLKITLIFIAALILLVVAALIFSNGFVKSKIERFLSESLPESVEVTYSEIDVDILAGRVILFNPKIKNLNSTMKSVNSTLVMDTLIVDGFGYWNYWRNDKLTVSSIQLHQPIIKYYHAPRPDKKNYKYSKLEQITQNIKIDRINVQNGQIEVRNLENDSLLLKTENFTANVMDLKLNPNTVKNRIPFQFDDYNVHFNKLFYNLGEYENISIESSKITTDAAEFNNIKLYTKYSKQALSSMISMERDHFDIDIESVVLKQQQFGYKQDSIFYFKSPEIIFESPELSLYRNKLSADDNTIKPLYSKMLRQLDFDLTLNKIELKNGKITYSERIRADADAAQIFFSKVYATIHNVSNTYTSSEKTSIAIKANFMNQAPLDIDWYFDVNDENDHFIFKADIGKLEASKLNMFTEPNLNVRLEGELNKTYITISGYDNTSTADLKLNYDDFKVIIMQKKENKKNQFLSAVANIFIKKSSENEDDKFREGSAEVSRNKTKSVFNYIWLNTSESLLKAMTGKGGK